MAATLSVPAAAQGTVTIGSNLGRAPDGPPGCLAGTCTYAIFTPFPTANAAPGGVTSPVNGTVTTWRSRSGPSTTPTAFRVIRPVGDGLFSGTGTSATVTPPIDSTTPFSIQLPIRIGDLIGIDCVSPCGYHFRDAGGRRLSWSPALTDGDPGRAAGKADSETLINADIEPTATLANVNAKAKKGGKVRVSAEAPNAGTLVAGDKADKSYSAVTSAKKKTRLLKKTTVQAGAAGPLSFVVKPTKAAKALLADGIRPKAKLKLVFTPTGGSAAAKVVKLRLKR